MEWLNRLSGRTVALDTAPLIYFIEEHPLFLGLVQPFFKAMSQGDFQVVTSTITLTEVLVNPIRRGQSRLAQQYRELLLNAANLRLFPITSSIAELAAGIRASRNLQTPDALQIATALELRADFFLTNDALLTRLERPEILLLSALR